MAVRLRLSGCACACGYVCFLSTSSLILTVLSRLLSNLQLSALYAASILILINTLISFSFVLHVSSFPGKNHIRKVSK